MVKSILRDDFSPKAQQKTGSHCYSEEEVASRLVCGSRCFRKKRFRIDGLAIVSPLKFSQGNHTPQRFFFCQNKKNSNYIKFYILSFFFKKKLFTCHPEFDEFETSLTPSQMAIIEMKNKCGPKSYSIIFFFGMFFPATIYINTNPASDSSSQSNPSSLNL